MGLAAGTRLGPYEIAAPLGAGGMGEVYRAKDTKLNRDVAIKVLPESFALDADRVVRFTREAQVLASLNHPNIAAIYGIEEQGATRALVMELVEGKDLSTLIDGDRGLPLDAARGKQTPGSSPGSKDPGLHLNDALPIARQIADALEAAHEQGIVHRDLKPANIKVRADGTVKVLDFGLAKAMDPFVGRTGVGSAEHADRSSVRATDEAATMTSPAMTAMGMILGTAAYMAPEQARGKAVDRRADIWAFGVVVYEMLTGTRAFPGDNITDTLAAVVRTEPDWSLVPKDLSPTLLVFLKRCLQKEPKQRLGDIRDMRLALDGAFDTTGLPTTAVAASSASRGRLGWIVASVLGLALLMALIPTVLYFRATPPNDGEVRFQIPVREMPNPLLTSISPDGRWIAYAALADDGRSALWLQSLGSLTAHVFPGTEGAGTPFWSPDSRTLAFVAGGRLKMMATSGGQATTIASRLPGTRGTWNREGVILVGAQLGQDSAGGIQRTSARGGEPTPATTVDKAGEETNHDFPFFLPDGRHFLYVAWSRQPQSRALYVGALDSAEKKRLMPAESMVVYSDGQLLFLRNRNLMAQAFDARRLELMGEPRVVAENIPTNPGVGGAAFNASTNGTLIYRTGSGIETEGRQLLWFDRQGKSLGELGAPDSYAWVRLSNDGKRVATQLTDSAGNADVWAIDIDRGARSRITFDPGVDNFPNWSADGRTIFFGSTRHGKYEIYQTSSTGTGGEQLMHGHPDTFTPLRDVSVDGRFLVYGTSKDGIGQRDIWALPTFGDRKAFPFVQTPFEEYSPAVSPDSRWMAYTTNESGGPQVVVQSFPDPSRARSPVSIMGGSEARWRRDGKELYYVAPDHKLMAVKITGDRELEVGTPVALFDTTIPFPRNDGSQSQRYYDVTADGQRFLIHAPREKSNPSPITVILNWTAGLKR